MAKKRIGNQNPTQSVILPYKKSLYQKAIDTYELSKRTAQEWQIILTKHIYAVNKDGLWVHTKFGYSLPRRNEKNEVVAIREMQGLEDGEQILHTAHRTTTSHTAWERLCRLLDKAGIEYESLRATGRERIEIPATGGRVEFRTRTSTGGLGEGFDLLVIDEAQEYTADQESALKYEKPSVSKPVSKPKINFKVDGYWGPETTRALQIYFSTVQDGIISGQYKNNVTNTISGVHFGSNGRYKGSLVIKELQKLLGVMVDGLLGKETIKKLQRRLGTLVDGKISKPSTMIKELQRRLNAGNL